MTTGPDREFGEPRTGRLVMRRFRPADVPTFAAHRSDPEVARYQSWNVPFSDEKAERFVAGLSEDDPDTPGSWFQFVVAEAAGGARVGDVAAYVDAEDPRQARVGVSWPPTPRDVATRPSRSPGSSTTSSSTAASTA